MSKYSCTVEELDKGNYRTKLQRGCAMAGCARCRDESPSRRDERYTVRLSMLEMEVTREWLAHGCTDPESLVTDVEIAEAVIAKLEALGAQGTL